MTLSRRVRDEVLSDQLSDYDWDIGRASGMLHTEEALVRTQYRSRRKPANGIAIEAMALDGKYSSGHPSRRTSRHACSRNRHGHRPQALLAEPRHRGGSAATSQRGGFVI